MVRPLRPARPVANVRGRREGRRLTFSNAGNVSAEIVHGRQCDADGGHCAELPGKRLYPGASWTVDLQSDRPAEYSLKSPARTEQRVFGRSPALVK